MDNFILTNELLLGSLWGDYYCNKGMGFSGYFNSDKYNLGRAFIEYCICKVFGIYRLPGCGYDRFQCPSYKFACLTSKDIDDACVELEKLYEYIQKRLLMSDRLKNGKIELVRSLRPFEINEITNQLKDEGIREILLPVNVFTSYAHDGDINSHYPGEYQHPINIRREIDVQDVLFWDSFVSFYRTSFQCNYLCSMADIEAEVFVMSRSINGWESIDRKCFIYDTLPDSKGYTSSKPLLEHNIRINNSSVFDTECGYVRPCEEDNFLTKFVMKRNQKKYIGLSDKFFDKTVVSGCAPS